MLYQWPKEAEPDKVPWQLLSSLPEWQHSVMGLLLWRLIRCLLIKAFMKIDVKIRNKEVGLDSRWWGEMVRISKEYKILNYSYKVKTPATFGEMIDWHRLWCFWYQMCPSWVHFSCCIGILCFEMDSGRQLCEDVLLIIDFARWWTWHEKVSRCCRGRRTRVGLIQEATPRVLEIITNDG